MRIFFIKLGGFLALLVLALAGLFALMFTVERNAYWRDMTLAPNVRYVSVSDSRSTQTLNPDVIHGLCNLSLPGAQPRTWKVQMEDLIKQNNDGKRRTFILEISPYQLNVARRRAVRDWDKTKALFWLLHPELQEVLPFNRAAYAFLMGEFPRQFLAWVGSLVSGMSFHCLVKGYYAAAAKQSDVNPVILMKNAEEDYERDKDFSISQEDRQLLDEFCAVVKGTNWDVVFFTHPTLGHGADKPCTKRFVDDLGNYCKSRACAYIDLTGLCPDVGYWLDAYHVNLRGAKIVCEELDRQLKAVQGLK